MKTTVRYLVLAIIIAAANLIKCQFSACGFTQCRDFDGSCVDGGQKMSDHYCMCIATTNGAMVACTTGKKRSANCHIYQCFTEKGCVEIGGRMANGCMCLGSEYGAYMSCGGRRRALFPTCKNDQCPHYDGSCTNDGEAMPYSKSCWCRITQDGWDVHCK